MNDAAAAAAEQQQCCFFGALIHKHQSKSSSTGISRAAAVFLFRFAHSQVSTKIEQHTRNAGVTAYHDMTRSPKRAALGMSFQGTRAHDRT